MNYNRRHENGRKVSDQVADSFDMITVCQSIIVMTKDSLYCFNNCKIKKSKNRNVELITDRQYNKNKKKKTKLL